MQYKGIDVSETQGNIDWENVGLDKIRFAMIRATYGSSGLDVQFFNNMDKILKTNIYAGAYHELEAGSIGEAVREANYFLNVVKPYGLSYPLAVSFENELAVEMGKEFFTSILGAFIDVIKENNYYPLLYISLEVLKSVDSEFLGSVDIWLRDFVSDAPIKPNYDKDVGVWQYTDMGVVFGIDGNVNFDISYCDYPKIIKERGLNNSNLSENGAILMNGNANNLLNNNTNENINLKNQTSETTGSDFYTVKKGETLKSIAEKVFGNSEDYKKLMELNGLTRPVIFAGQILRVPMADNTNTFSYRVVPGDTLWNLAQRFLGYGPRYNEIMAENGLTSDMIYPGQILKIKAENGNNNGSGNSNNISSPYIVKKGDTLWKIAQDTLGNGNRYSEIMKLNNLKDGNLTVGQPLIIPSN